MGIMPTPNRPLVLLTTATTHRDVGLRRLDAVTGVNYSQAVAAEGGLPVMAANLDPAVAEALVERVDGLLLTGGGDVDPARYGHQPHPRLGRVDPERDAFELAAYRAARARRLPVLAICRGPQLVNVAHGGTLHQHLPARAESIQHDQADISGRPLHPVAIAPGSALARALGASALSVNTFHHQAIDALGEGLVAVAHSADGVIEAIEGADPSGGWLLGVQWHPELTYAAYPEQRAPFRAFLDAVRAARAAAHGRAAGPVSTLATRG
jgi:putative glutamine amidotransferase